MTRLLALLRHLMGRSRRDDPAAVMLRRHIEATSGRSVREWE